MNPALGSRSWLTPLAVLASLLVACGGSADEHYAPAASAAEPEPALELEPEAGTASEACVGAAAMAEPLPVDLFAVLDGSSSMGEATQTGVSKWYATKAAFHDFLLGAPADTGFGLSLFPGSGDGAASCSTQHYREQALPIGAVAAMADGARERLDAVTPAGQTPTAPAFTAALDVAQTHALTHPDRSVVVVLATDGVPTTCAPTETAALATLAKTAFEGPGHVRTLVVALRPLGGREAPGFEEIARAGGTTRALQIDPRADFSFQLTQALRTTVERKVACDLALPNAPDHERLDYDAVNVVLEGAEVRVTVPRVEGAAACGLGGGWYYDVEPGAGAPSRLNVCRSSCERVSALAAKLSVELGCKTVVR